MVFACNELALRVDNFADMSKACHVVVLYMQMRQYTYTLEKKKGRKKENEVTVVYLFLVDSFGCAIMLDLNAL